MAGILSNLLGMGYAQGLAQIAFVSVIGAAILYAKHGIGTFGMCVIAAIAGYSGSWYVLALWGGTPSLLTCEMLGGFFGVATASVWLKLREAQADSKAAASGRQAGTVLGK